LKKDKIIISLLAVSLIMNAYAIFRISELRELVVHDFENYFDTTVEDELDEINDELSQIKQGQQWLSNVTIKNGGIVDNEQIINLSWQVKDYVSGSEVTFFYRRVGEESFRQLTAVSQTTGNFETKMEIDKEDQPQWFVSFRHGGQKKTISQIDKDSLYRFEYYVVLDDGNHILSSDVQDFSLEKILQIYSSIDVDISLDNEKMPSAIEFYVDEDKLQPDQFILEIYNDNAVTEDIIKIKNDEDMAAKWEAADYKFNKIIVKAQYEDGKTYQKEIWNGKKAD